MRKYRKKIILAAVFFLMFAIGAQAKNLPPEVGVRPAALTKPSAAEADKNGNKIFDSLDSIIKTKGPSEKTKVIVLFDRPFRGEDYDQLVKEIGPFTTKYKYDRVPGMATSLSKRQIAELASRPDVLQIEDDKKVTAFLNTATNWFGVQKGRTDFNVDGNSDGSPGYSKDDMVIAVIDTGIDIGHVDLDNGKVIGWKDFVNGRATAYDDVGHGTHVASIAAGEGEGNPAYKGVAPGAALVGIKVLGPSGGLMSDVEAGIEWAIDNKTKYGIDVINLSLGTNVSSDGSDGASLAANSAMANDIVVAISAGNEGPARYTIGSPGAAADVITVGAMADPGEGGFFQASFSSRGPTADNRIKPDISAPGWRIMAAQDGRSGNQYTEKSGTSMSSPFTAGVAALMRQANPALSAGDIKNTIMSTARDWGPPGTDIDYGAGRLESHHAIRAAAAASGRTVSTPKHMYLSGSLSTSVTEEWWNINVTDNTYPIGVTMVMSNWNGSADPDFDMALFDPGSNQVGNDAIGTQRQETITHQPTQTGTYQLRVYRYAGAGDYFVDLSAGTHMISITLDTDGAVPLGVLGFGETTTTGEAEKEIVRVDADPANLDIRTSLFSDGGNDWSLGPTNGNDTVKWEFSPDNLDWTTFLAENTNYPLVEELASTTQQAVYFRLTMPSGSSSGQAHSSLVTVTAVAP